MMLRFLMGVGALAMVAVSVVACGDEATPETLCEPGEEIFCKCRGGYQGTKTCLDDGQSFGECTTLDGPCPEIPDTTSSSSTTSSSNTSGGGGGGGTGTKTLYQACTAGDECLTGRCESGFCTLDCQSYEVCSDDANEAYGDCVVLPGGAQVCAPYCVTQSECAAYGAESSCNGAIALDDPNILFATCGAWGDALAGMPSGTPCEEGAIIYLDQVIDAECDLGATGVQNICLFGECSKGCYEPADCPQEDCTSSGAAPGCCSSDPDCN